MIVERAEFNIEPGREEEFEGVYESEARQVIAQATGFISVRLARGVERPSAYLLLVEWERVEDHTEGFRGSELYEQWRTLLHPFFAEAPVVEHFAPTENS
jgi:heme-degrading monooxygenase HmoA